MNRAPNNSPLSCVLKSAAARADVEIRDKILKGDQPVAWHCKQSNRRADAGNQSSFQTFLDFHQFMLGEAEIPRHGNIFGNLFRFARADERGGHRRLP